MLNTFEEKLKIFEKAQKNNLAFGLDWKFPVEDIVFNIKSILPELDITAPHERQVFGDWIQPMILEGREYLFRIDSEHMILDVIATANNHLKKTNQTLIFFDTQDDDFLFILIKLSEIPEYLEKGFKEVFFDEEESI